MPKRSRGRANIVPIVEDDSEDSSEGGYSEDSDSDNYSELDSIDSVLLASKVPRDAKIVALLLKSLGVENVGVRVIPQFLEFMNVYVSEILREARAYAKHQQSSLPKRKSKKKKKSKVATGSVDELKISLEDVRLATQARIHYSFIQPPPRELMLELSSNKNRIPLPMVPLNDRRVRLPPEEFRVRNHPWNTSLNDDDKLKMKREKEFDTVDDLIGRPPPPPPPSSSMEHLKKSIHKEKTIWEENKVPKQKPQKGKERTDK